MSYAITYSASQLNKLAEYTPMVIVDDEFQYERHLEFEEEDGFRGCVSLDGYFYVASGRAVFKITHDFDLKEVAHIGNDNHGMVFHHGHLYVVSTEESVIYKLSLDLKVVDKIEAKTIYGEPLCKGAHINSVDFLGGLPVITAHNGNGEGYIYIAAPSNNIILARHLDHPHDFRVIRDGYMFLNSQQRKVCCHRMPIERCWEIELPEYTRGLEIVDDIAYVGCSGRTNNFNCVVGIDLVSGDTIGQWPLPTNFGIEIYSIVKI